MGSLTNGLELGTMRLKSYSWTAERVCQKAMRCGSAALRYRIDSDLANVLVSLERFEEAHDLFASALKDCEALMGSKSRRSLIIRHRWSFCYYRQRDWDEAKRMAQETLATFSEILVPGILERPDLQCLIGRVLCEQGGYAESAELLSHALHEAKRIAGETEPLTIHCAIELAETYRTQNRLEDAEQVLQTTYDRTMEVGGQAREVLVYDLAALRQVQGHYAAAAKHFDEVSNSKERYCKNAQERAIWCRQQPRLVTEEDRDVETSDCNGQTTSHKATTTGRDPIDDTVAEGASRTPEALSIREKEGDDIRETGRTSSWC